MAKIFSFFIYSLMSFLFIAASINFLLWLYFNAYKLFMNIIWQNKKFGQWLKKQTLPIEERVLIEKGKIFDDLDIAFQSSIEEIPKRKSRQYYMIRRNSLMKKVREIES